MSNISRQGLDQVIGTSIVTLVCLAAIGLLQIPQLNELKQQSTNPSLDMVQQQQQQQQVQLELLNRLPTFGFDNLLSDWVFLNFLQYFGDQEAREKTNYSLSPDFFEIILKHNPYFLPAYTFLSSSTALYAGMPERAVDLASQGLESLTPTTPDGSYFVWRNKAIDELLFLGDSQAARRSFETAAEWASQSNQPGSEQVAALSRQTAQFLAANPASKTAQAAAWAMVLQNAPDDRTRGIAIAQIESLGGQVLIDQNGAIQMIPPAQD